MLQLMPYIKLMAVFLLMQRSPFQAVMVTFSACSTSYYHLKLLGILENSTGKEIALPV